MTIFIFKMMFCHVGFLKFDFVLAHKVQKAKVHQQSKLHQNQNRNRWHNRSITAKQVSVVWACVTKEYNDWVKKCTEYEVEGSRPRGRPKSTWREVLQKTVKHVH